MNHKEDENTSYPTLANFACRMLTLPHSNAAIERIFSTMGIAKGRLQNRMGIDLLNSILMIR